MKQGQEEGCRPSHKGEAPHITDTRVPRPGPLSPHSLLPVREDLLQRRRQGREQLLRGREHASAHGSAPSTPRCRPGPREPRAQTLPVSPAPHRAAPRAHGERSPMEAGPAPLPVRAAPAVRGPPARSRCAGGAGG